MPKEEDEASTQADERESQGNSSGADETGGRAVAPRMRDLRVAPATYGPDAHSSEEHDEYEDEHEVEAAEDDDGGLETLDFRGEYSKPNVEIALEYQARHHPRDAQGRPLGLFSTDTGTFGVMSCECCGPPRLGLLRYGVAVSYHFKWLKHLGYMWAWLLLLQIPVLLVTTRAGDYLSGSASPAVASLGNLYREPLGNDTLISDRLRPQDELMDTRLPFFCDDTESVGRGTFGDDDEGLGVPTRPESLCTLDRELVSLIYAMLDALTTAVFLIFVCCASAEVRRETRRFQKRTRKLEHYSLRVSGLPADASAEQLKTHFEGLVRGRVHEVQVVHATGDAIALCMRRGKLLKRLARADAHRKALEAALAPADKLEKAERAFDKLEARAKAVDDAVVAQRDESDDDGRALFAFVTFERQRDRAQCLKLYETWTCSLKQSPLLRLDGKAPLSVRPAPAPSQLLWENFEVSRKSRLARGAATGVLMFMLLLLTALISAVSEPYKLSKAFADAVTSGGSFDSICGGAFAGTGSFEDAVALAQDPVASAGFSVPGREDLTMLDCLCEATLSISELDFPNGTLPANIFAGDGACGPYLAARAEALSVQAAVSFATLLVNTLIFVALSASSSFMRFTSILQRETALARQLFVFTYINSGILVVLVNADWAELLGLKLTGAGGDLFGGGVHSDITQEWFRTTGAEIVLIATLNIFAPHVYPLLLALATALYRRMHKPVSQTDMNSLMLGPDFILSYRVATVLTQTFLVMTWSTGLPVLYAIALPSVLVQFWVDKAFYTKVCRTPPELSGRLHAWACGAMQWAAALHLAVGIWTLSSPVIFPRSGDDLTLGTIAQTGFSGNNPGDNSTALANADSGEGFFWDAQRRILVPQSAPMLVLLLLFVAYKVLRNVRFLVRAGRALLRLLGVALTLCFCGNPLSRAIARAAGDEEEDEARARRRRRRGSKRKDKAEDLTVTEAVSRGVLSGTRSYFILANTRLARAFQFYGDWETANEGTVAAVLRQRALGDGGISSSFTVPSSVT